MFEEENQERFYQAHGLGEYAKGSPDKATGSTATHAESGPALLEPTLPAGYATYHVIASTCAGDPGYEYLVVRYPAHRCIPHVFARFTSLEDADVFVKARELADRIPPPF